MKRAILSMALILMASLFGDAFAQGTARMHHRRAMAHKGYYHPTPGRYSPSEKARLKRQKSEIRFLKHQARANGYVSFREKRKIQRAEVRYHRMKHYAKRR